MKLLLIKGEKSRLEEMVDYFSTTGWVCEQAKDFDEATLKISTYTYDNIVLDVDLQGGNGMELISRIRARKIDTGIVILSGKKSIADKVNGLNLGGDDYLTKPFHLEELGARINALHRRKAFKGAEHIIFDEFKIDTESKLLWHLDKLVKLTKKEYLLLIYFIVNRNRVLSKSAIAEHIWGDSFDEADNFDAIYVHMVNLRKKLLKASGKDYITTAWGMGYKFADH